jgi:hypothetical protein
LEGTAINRNSKLSLLTLKNNIWTAIKHEIILQK